MQLSPYTTTTFLQQFPTLQEENVHGIEFSWLRSVKLKGMATFEAHFHVLPIASYSWL